MPPRRPTTGPAAAAAASGRSARTASSSSRRAKVPSPAPSDSDSGLPDEDEEMVKPAPKKVTRGRVSKATASRPSTSTRRSARLSMASNMSEGSISESAQSDALSQGEEEDEEETLKPAKAAKGRSGSAAVSKAKKPPSRKRVVESSDEDEEEETPTIHPSKAAIPQLVSEDESGNQEEVDIDATPAPKRPSKIAVASDEEEEDVEATPAPKRSTKVRMDSDEEDLEDFEATPAPKRTAPFGQVPVISEPVQSPQATKPISHTEIDDEDAEEADKTITLESSDLAGNLPPVTPPRPTASQDPSSSRIPLTPGPSTQQAPKPTGPKPRLTIHKLVLVNFKSYAGRQEIGPFHKSFSAIVGPNGSGKSNTIDALLFVFGYRASKMRQGKLSELIHNSAGKEGLETCSVEVWFREIVDLPGVDKFLLVPNSQLVVTRTAFRNNSSKYTINDKTSSFSEVTTLLKGKGIDLDHNRFLILQGEVESIAQMKAKAQNEHEDGLLEYLEDIIGTTKYKEPIEQASQEVETLNEERGEKMNRLRVVEREKSALEDKKREAEDFLRDSNELTRKKSLLWQFHMHTLNNNLDITTKAIDALTTELADEQQRNAGHLAEIADLQKGYEEKLTAFEEVKRLSDALVKDSKKFEKEEVGLQEKKKHLNTKLKKLKKSLTDDGHSKSEASATFENLSAELETNRAKVTTLESKLETEEAELEEIRDGLKDKTDEFTTKIEAKQRELEPWTAKISEKQSAIDVATSERDLLIQKATGAQTALDEAKESLKSLKEGGQGKQEQYAELKKEAAKVKKALAEKEQEFESLSSQAEVLRTKVSTSRSKTDEARASLAADKSENAVLSSLNKLKTQGRIKGFHGRLGDLGVIDDKYDVAVTTACGSLNNLVVDTVEQGQACIEHLRKGNVGRASFMVLEKLPPRDLNPIETPENVPRLFDLIKPKDPKFAPAFYKGVFNTLVANDLAQAQRIGYGKKRWRVVTLAGQLIDPSGTMSGGGTKVSRGGMSSKFAADKVAPEVVVRYEQESAAAEKNFAEFQRNHKEVEIEVSQLRKRLPEIEISMEKIEMDVQTGAKRVAEAEKRLAELQTQSKPDAADESRIKQLKKEISSLESEVAKLREKSSGISDQIKELQNKILEVGGVKLRAIQSKVTVTKGLLDMANESITKAEVGQAKAQRDIEKLNKALESNKVKIEEAEADAEVVDGDLTACTADLNVLREKVQEAMDASTDVQEALAEAKAELDEKSGHINAFRALEMDIKQKIEDNARIQKDSKNKFEHWRKRHDELELAFVDEDDEEEEDGAVEEDESKTAGDITTQTAETTEEGDRSVQVDKQPKKRSKNDSMELPEYSTDELRTVDKEMLNAEITQLEEDIGKAKPNLNVLVEYRRREAEFLDRARDMEAVTSSRDAAKKRYDDLRKVRLDEFMAGFSAISSKLKEMYQMITMGGNAEIELIDSMDPFSEGVVLSIMPPKKSWRAIANLSGGEKTLASLALVFALHVFKPTPLYFMDEIDAALDFKNVSIVANYIQSKTQAAQFIVISLRNDMFELAHRLVGIYKTSNCTKSVAIDNKDLRTQAVPKPRRPLGPGSPDKTQQRPRPSHLTVPATMRKLPSASQSSQPPPASPLASRV